MIFKSTSIKLIRNIQVDDLILTTDTEQASIIYKAIIKEVFMQNIILSCKIPIKTQSTNLYLIFLEVCFNY